MLGLAWTVVTNLIMLGTIVAVSDAGSGRFERVVLAVLSLSYLSITTGLSMIGRVQLEHAAKNSLQFARLAELANDPHAASYKDATAESTRVLEGTKTKYQINMGAAFIGWCIALFSLFSAL